MNNYIKTPSLPESVADATVDTWNVKEGDSFKRDQILVEIETDKIVLEVRAEQDGKIVKINEPEGSTVQSEQQIGEYIAQEYKEEQPQNQPEAAKKQNLTTNNVKIDPNTTKIDAPKLPEAEKSIRLIKWHYKQDQDVRAGDLIAEIEGEKTALEVNAPTAGTIQSISINEGEIVTSEANLCIFKAKEAEKKQEQQSTVATTKAADTTTSYSEFSPSIRRMIGENNLNPQSLNKPNTAQPQQAQPVIRQATGERTENKVPMSRLRKKVAERLLSSKNSTAMLTTFNEVNMKPIMDLRKKHQEQFIEANNVKLGFMSFYVKAVVESLKKFPIINASIDGDNIVYYNYFDISIAVSTERGLITPVIRDCDQLSFAEIEAQIKYLAQQGASGGLTIEDLAGGNFTITNGGVFGSMMSTPIINPPQSAILGMHAIQDRPVAVNKEVKILPMMYLALSYDHRIIDGKDSVSFLVSIKQMLENPEKILLGL